MLYGNFAHPRPEESSIVGSFSVMDGKVVEDAPLARIKWLVREVFHEVAKDDRDWRTLKDPDTCDFWELDHPHAEMQGGGPPRVVLRPPGLGWPHHPEPEGGGVLARD